MREFEREPVQSLREKLKKKGGWACPFGSGMVSAFFGIFSFHTFLSWLLLFFFSSFADWCGCYRPLVCFVRL